MQAAKKKVAKPSDMALVGKRALLTGLQRMPQYNNEWGKVEAFDPDFQRFVVRIVKDNGGQVVAKLRRENLIIPPTVALKFADEDLGSAPGAAVDAAAAPPARAVAPVERALGEDAQAGELLAKPCVPASPKVAQNAIDYAVWADALGSDISAEAAAQPAEPVAARPAKGATPFDAAPRAAEAALPARSSATADSAARPLAQLPSGGSGQGANGRLWRPSLRRV